MRYRYSLVVVSIFVFQSAAWAQFDWFRDKLKNLSAVSSPGMSSDTKIAEGLKEALKVGIQNAVKKYAENSIQPVAQGSTAIQLPESLKTLDKGLRLAGFGGKVDSFVAAMNSAAGKAVPSATQIFVDAVGAMKMEDIQKIFKGSDTAATEYFRSKTSDSLTKAFKPIVNKSLQEYGVSAQYQSLLDRYRALPLAAKVPVPEIDTYVVDKALAGLFTLIGEEEKKIRTDPASRVTKLLREVFK